MFIDGLIFPVPCFYFLLSVCLCVLFILFCFVFLCLFVLMSSTYTVSPNPYMPFRTLITCLTSQLHLQAHLLCTSNSSSLKRHDFIHSFHRLSFYGAFAFACKVCHLTDFYRPPELNSGAITS